MLCWRACSSGSANAVDRIGAKRVVLDTIESLFASLPNEAVLRGELRRLFRWVKDRGPPFCSTSACQP
ncbi:MAG: ATPase domain-containing protein [Rubrivivax sp.]